MTKLDFFCEWDYDAAAAIDAVRDAFPCFINMIPVEMNWMEISIEARIEDMPRIEILLAGIM